MTYRIEIGDRALRELNSLETAIRARITIAIDGLKSNPRPPGAKKLSGANGFRIRAGDYRVLYVINDKDRLIRVYRVGHRREIYRGF